MSKGFVQIRRGIEEHLLAGRLGLFEFGVYLIIHFQVDFETGVWTGSAPRILAAAPRSTSLRDVQRALARLEQLGFIRTFHQQGQRGNYRVLINKYEPQTGALKGQRLNAQGSLTWRSPVYEPCTDTALSPRTSDVECVIEPAGYLKIEQDKERRLKGKKKEFAGTGTPRSADARYHPFFSFAEQSFFVFQLDHANGVFLFVWQHPRKR